jgi:uncharacterized membrane protein
MKVRTGVRAGATQAIDLETQERVSHSERYWEIDSTRGFGLAEMLALHIIRTWLKVLSPSLALVMLKIWQQQKVLVEILLLGPFLAGALAKSSNVSQTKDQEQLSEGETGLPAPVLAMAYLILPTLIYWLATSGSGAALFLMISGISMAIDYQRRKGDYSEKELFQRFLRRSFNLFAWGTAVSLLSLLLTPGMPVLFGILQLFSIASLLVFPFLQLPAWASLAGGTSGIVLGGVLADKLATPWLVWLSETSLPLSSTDYHPLLPWFGVILLGVWVGKTLYKKGERSFRFPNQPGNRIVDGLSWMGKNSLGVYLAQTPLTLLGYAFSGL